MPNFPGSDNALPGAYSQVETLSSGASTPTGTRVAVIMGEGARRETIVGSANGNGNDGLNPTYTSTTGRDGRHFLLSNAPIISNRTQIFKNGIPLNVIEGTIPTDQIPGNYDCMVDIDNGHIALQQAALVDQGGKYYTVGAFNSGNGTLSNVTLVDPNAPTESWLIRCTSVRRDGYGVIIPTTQKFIATGSVSGTILDGYGNIITWYADGYAVSNNILSFAINDGASHFREGDSFTVSVNGGVLSAGDSLTATYIAVTDLNDPQFFTDMDSIAQKHGAPSYSTTPGAGGNRLSLGGQITFANSTPGVWTCQCAPSVPRRTSYELTASASGGSTADDLTFPLPIGVQPDVNSNVHLFVTDPLTGVETQILPNRVAFYNSTFSTNPGLFTNGSYVYSYTVIQQKEVVKDAIDGILTAAPGGLTATLSSSTVTFGIDDLGANILVKIFDATNSGNNYNGWVITSVNNGIATISGTMSHPGTFVTESSIRFQVIDTTAGKETTAILLTADAALAAQAKLRATIVDTKDATFFDAGWIAAYEAIEVIDVDIVVPLPAQTISAIFQNGAAHCRTMSNIKNRKERVLFIGAISGLTPDNVLGTKPAAVEDIGILEGIQGDSVSELLAGNTEDLANYGVQAAYGNTYRVVYFYPDQIVVQVGSDNVLVDGFFISAAAAGYLSGMPNIALPLTRKTLSGFTILRNRTFRPITLENLTAYGITVLQPVTGGGIVIRGQTTTNSGFLEEREISIVFIRDRIAKDLRSAMEGFVGGVDSDITQANLSTRANSTLTGFVNRGLITTYRDLKIERDKVDPTQWNVSVKVQPVYPINFIYIRVSVGLLE